ncbi:MAG: site-2 protease family protein [Candidatus Marinimicrobia bacterium]|nr:site-2 protease family protein [Candidatus Neomarinimicrobiota bacterium]
MNLQTLQTIVLLVPPILLALSFHEYMHGWVANKLGDPTAERNGRLTMNPLAHLDPFGTLMIFLVHFGWAKPVPVNPINFENPKQDLTFVSIAGPLANMFLALLSGILLRIVGSGLFNFLPINFLRPFYQMIVLSLQINIALAFFNLLPLPPLDGSKILFGLLPDEYDHIAVWLRQYGGFILMGLILFGYLTNVSIIGGFLRPFINFFSRLFGGI